jgi:hypothetical protein
LLSAYVANTGSYCARSVSGVLIWEAISSVEALPLYGVEMSRIFQRSA